jgi:CTP:molybdopterin cytidylyltransferase MocA
LSLGSERTPEVCVLILAAGSGRRLGLGPKAHVVLGEETFLARVVRTCREARLGPIRVIGSVHDTSIIRACVELGVLLTTNAKPERGMSSSVHAGLLAARDDGLADGALVFPVDFPLVTAPTVELLRLALLDRRDVWARPIFDGRSGHPVAIGAELILRLLAMGDAPLRDALKATGATIVEVPCDDGGVVADIDIPNDLVAARAAMQK